MIFLIFYTCPFLIRGLCKRLPVEITRSGSFVVAGVYGIADARTSRASSASSWRRGDLGNRGGNFAEAGRYAVDKHLKERHFA